MITTVIDTHLAAYNRRDVDAFVTCFADPVRWWSRGTIVDRSHDELRLAFTRLFADCPELHVEVSGRLEVGPWVVDREVVTGLYGGQLTAVLAHRVVNGLIVEVLVLGEDD